MAQVGQILHYRDFRFEDGSVGNKLFVVLNEADINSPCLVLKTTSQPTRYIEASEGCNSGKRVFFIPQNWQECFSLDTYIQLPQIFEISTEELLKGSLANKSIDVIGSLSVNCFAQLKNCLKKFRYDISPDHWKLIF